MLFTASGAAMCCAWLRMVAWQIMDDHGRGLAMHGRAMQGRDGHGMGLQYSSPGPDSRGSPLARSVFCPAMPSL